MFKSPKVIGVYHNINHPDFSKVVGYIKENVNEGNIVSIESLDNLTTILNKYKDSKHSQRRFFYNVCETLQNLGADIRTVEDERAYKLQGRRQIWFMFDGKERLENDWIWQKLSVYRSVSLLKLAKKEKSDYLITGIFHAYDLNKMGYENVEFI